MGGMGEAETWLGTCLHFPNFSQSSSSPSLGFWGPICLALGTPAANISASTLLLAGPFSCHKALIGSGLLRSLQLLRHV